MRVTLNLVEVECNTCHTTFAMAARLDAERRADRKTFFCPLGHSLWYPGETAVKRLERQLASAQQDATFYRDNLRAAERSLAATRGVVTKLKKKVEAGVCPVDDCRRNFANVGRHVRRMHPDWNGEA